jgi:hypothetical protein
MIAISDMNSEELRIACAEQMGWELWLGDYVGDKIIITRGYRSEDSRLVDLPDYENDLNARMELLRSIPQNKQEYFVQVLLDLVVDCWNINTLLLLPIFKLLTIDSIYIMKAFLTTMEFGKE